MQKNIKKNKGVKDWPWWKLFTTVRPLIEVQLSEEQIRNKDVRNSPGRGGLNFIHVGQSFANFSWAPQCSFLQAKELVSLNHAQQTEGVLLGCWLSPRVSS